MSRFHPQGGGGRLMVDKIRYFFALLLVVMTIPAILHWLLIHPFVGFWRKLGPWLTYIIIIPLLVAFGALVYRARGPLLAVDFGTNLALLPLAIILYGISVYISFEGKKQLKFRTLVGLPELAPTKVPAKLLTEGIYARTRHPRYVAVILGVLGWCFFANYLATYLLVPVTVLALYLITVLEEKELHARFGEEYERYRQRVPRFIPKWKGPVHS